MYHIKFILVLCISILSSYYDLKFRIIPNRITFPAILAGFIINILESGTAGAIESAKGLFTGFGLLFIFYITIGGIGEGDLKLLAAFGAVGGVNFAARTFIFGTIIGGLGSIYFLIKEKKMLLTLKTLALWSINAITGGRYEHEILNSGQTMPYGPFLSSGAIISLFLTGGILI